ncbi:YitT family protein [Paenibacillus ihumii]|uniref:YitT family protein n=1 Tax=Paenibacillus ihumii TaxID=687436 RepID=UPI0006D7C43A|nr:YitT family protein [Paenibacillus ihumii]
MRQRIIDMSSLIVGAFLFALAVNLFVIPNDLGEGGVTGLTIILYYLFGWSPGLMNLILNGILLLVGYKFLDKKTMQYTIIVVVLNSIFLHLTEGWRIDSNELWVNTLFGGVFIGAGIGMIVRVGGTTAGSVILARITNKYLDWNISYGLLFFDLIVACSSVFIIGAKGLMSTIVLLFTATKVMNFIIEGLNPQKAVTIISDKQDHIARHVIDRMDRGVTVLSGYGYYTKDTKEILYIIISKKEVPMLKEIVRAEDINAFITIQDVRDVFGEGFLKLSK